MLHRNSFYGLTAGIAAASYALVGFLYFRAERAASVPGIDIRSGTIEFCLFKQTTGVACPSCGTGRSILMILDGHLASALMTNPLGFLAAVLMIAVPGWMITDLVRRRDSLYRYFLKAENIISGNRWLIGLLVALIAANWIWNITKGV